MKPEIAIPEDLKSAILFGHADADGHLAAEQSRDWLVRRGMDVDVVVSSETWNYNFWKKLPHYELSRYGLVVVVDIAFRFRDPEESLSRLLSVADSEQHVKFVVIDHHPLLEPREPRENVQLVQVDDPYDCCLGEPNPELMQVAALCDGAPTFVQATETLKKRALGVKRAAADLHGVAGHRLLQLIRQRNWEFFEALSEEDSEMHRSTRGRRNSSSTSSPLLNYARNLPT